MHYALLILAALILLFPLFFSLSLALQGPTMAPSLMPDFSKLDWGVFEPGVPAGAATWAAGS